MGSNDLKQYIQDAKSHGATDDKIRDTLLKNGWQDADISAALNPTPESDVPVAPPPAPHFGMWIGFLYIILFISLYVSATAFANIIHFAVDEYIPDSLDKVSYGYYSGQYLMQTYLACLIVGFPIFAILFLILKSQTLKTPVIKSFRTRKMLVYITLIGTFIIMIGHVIMTVYGFLGGTVTSRALAHLGVTFLVAGGIFAYFMADIWGDRKQT